MPDEMEKPAWRNWWLLSDDELFAQCEFDRYRASGPGGQKRNKTDSAVRLRHLPTKLIVTAADSRSQHLNRRRALERLREALAYEFRQGIDPDAIPTFLMEQKLAGKLLQQPRNPIFLMTASWVLELLDSHHGRLAETASAIGISTAPLVKFFETTPGLWQAAARIRQRHHQRPIRTDDSG